MSFLISQYRREIRIVKISFLTLLMQEVIKLYMTI